MSITYRLYIHTTRSSGELTALLGESRAPDDDGWTSLDGARFVVGVEDARGTAIIAESYGVAPSHYAQLERDKERLEGNASIYAAVWRVVAATEGDLMFVATGDEPLLWRYRDRGTIDGDRHRADDPLLTGRPPGWTIGTAADLPPSVPFPDALL